MGTSSSLGTPRQAHGMDVEISTSDRVGQHHPMGLARNRQVAPHISSEHGADRRGEGWAGTCPHHSWYCFCMDFASPQGVSASHTLDAVGCLDSPGIPLPTDGPSSPRSLHLPDPSPGILSGLILTWPSVSGCFSPAAACQRSSRCATAGADAPSHFRDARRPTGDCYSGKQR